MMTMLMILEMMNSTSHSLRSVYWVIGLQSSRNTRGESTRRVSMRHRKMLSRWERKLTEVEHSEPEQSTSYPLLFV